MPAETSLHQTSPRTASQDIVPLREKAAMGVGSLVDNLGGTAMHQLANPVYNILLGLNPAIIGVVIAVGRLVDAVLDPVIGAFSDNFRSRFGRRRPLIVLGALTTGPMFLLVFFCPLGWSPVGYAVYFSATMLLYYVAFTLFSIPLKGLQYELTGDYHERTRVSTIAATIMPVGSIISSWLFAISQWSGFGDPLTGVRYTAAIVMVLFGLLGIVPALLVKERYYQQAQAQPKVSFRENFRALLGNRPLMLISAGGGATLIGIYTVYSLGLYLNIYYVHGGDVKTASIYHGSITTAYQIASIVSAPIIGWMATRMGKRRAFIVCLGVALVGTVIKWFCYVPGHPALMFIPMIMMGMGMSGFWVITASMMADISDYAEWKQGFRNEATVGAVFLWIFKTGVSAAFFISGFVLLWVGFNEKLGGGQGAETILWMRLLFSFVPAVALAVAIACIARFPITEAVSREVRRELDQRRGQRDAAPA
jgi:GPH family glycoside/pentoside/hexuronide:cation symporter